LIILSFKENEMSTGKQRKCILSLAIASVGLAYYFCRRAVNKKAARNARKQKESRIGYKYAITSGCRMESVQDELYNATKEAFSWGCIMMGGRDSAELFKNLIRISNAKNGIEVGVFTGYTTLAMALALPDDGKIWALDVENGRKWVELGQKYWKKAGVDKKITVDLTGARGKMEELLKDEKNIGAFDFAFVDADKVNYDIYYELLLQLLKSGGWIAFDNVLWGYSVIGDPKYPAKDGTEHLQRLNEKLQKDERVYINMLDIADGVTIVVKK